jgi:hypothetical protein
MNARQFRQPLAGIPKEPACSDSAIVFIAKKADIKRGHSLRIESGVNRLKPQKALRHQSGASEQDDGKRDLGDDQQPMSVVASGGAGGSRLGLESLG